MGVNELIIVEEDGRSLPQIIQDVHLTNLGLKERSFEQQVSDRIYLQDCIVCWELYGVNPPIRSRIEKVLNEKYWLVGDVPVLKRQAKTDTVHQLLPHESKKEESQKKLS